MSVVYAPEDEGVVERTRFSALTEALKTKRSSLQWFKIVCVCGLFLLTAYWTFFDWPTPVQLEARVANGISFLDEKYGPEWRQKINWDALSIASNSRCVLGQLEESYVGGKRKFNLDTTSAVRYGFFAPSINPWKYFRVSGTLTRMWREMGSVSSH